MGVSRLLLSCVLGLLPVCALAQTQAPGTAAPVVDDPLFPTCRRSTQWQFEQLAANHLRLTGQVQVECPQMSFFADVIDLFTEPELRLGGSGNVVFTTPEGR